MPKNLTNRSEDYSKWYNELVVKADLAENSSVRGCMVIKPYGYAIWEKIQKELDNKFKETGHYNAYFPLFVPKSLFEAEENLIQKGLIVGQGKKDENGVAQAQQAYWFSRTDFKKKQHNFEEYFKQIKNEEELVNYLSISDNATDSIVA